MAHFLMLVAIPATAAPVHAGDFYVEKRGGLSFARDFEIYDPVENPPPGITPSTIELNFDKRPVASILLGYQHRSGFAVELDLGYRRASVGGVNILDGGGREIFFPGRTSIVGPASDVGVGFEGRLETYSGLVNLVYGIEIDRVRPFLGVGVGVAHVRGDIIETGSTGVALDFAVRSDTVFAYQGIAGIEVAANENLSVTVLYGYFAALDPQLEKQSTSGGFRRDIDVASHNLMVGLRWRF